MKFYVISGLLLASLGFLLKINFVKNPFDQKNYCEIFPCKAINFLKDNPDLKDAIILNSYDWGGYLIYSYPDSKIFIDGRLPQYKFEKHTLLQEYLDFFDIEKTENKLNKHNIDLVIYKKKAKLSSSWVDKHILLVKEKNENKDNDFPLYLDNSPDWQKVFQDDVSIIWKKSNMNK